MAVVSQAQNLFRTIVSRIKRLHIYGKIFLLLWLAFYIAIVVFIVVVTPSRIAQFLHDQATKLSHLQYGWLILAGAIVACSFPPLIGHTTLSTLCGFAFGLRGFYITSTASLVGSCLVFVILRTTFGARIRSWKNSKWEALETVIRAKGLPLIILIRVSPFPPWVYSNSLFASIESVTLWQFATATLFILPKLFLAVLIGSRMAPLSDGDSRDRMDTNTKILNSIVVGGGIIVAFVASWLVYSLVQKEIRTLEGVDPDVDRLAAEAIEEFDEQAPLLRSGSPEP
ncbi:Golgi apparatus membrane protein TVP38 [Mycena floridula]|nr:Golgi apparatus membrane protein TVP38 [Mycena floridula]